MIHMDQPGGFGMLAALLHHMPLGHHHQERPGVKMPAMVLAVAPIPMVGMGAIPALAVHHVQSLLDPTLVAVAARSANGRRLNETSRFIVARNGLGFLYSEPAGSIAVQALARIFQDFARLDVESP
jgi:hypothetical protein